MQVYPGFVVQFKYRDGIKQEVPGVVKLFVYSYEFNFIERRYTLYFNIDTGEPKHIELKYSDLEFLRISPVMMQKRPGESGNGEKA